MPATRPLHYCNHCNTPFSRAHILRDHLNSIQGIKPYFCSNCPTTFSRRYDLKVHQKEQHSIEPPTFRCRVEVPDGPLGCEKVFKRKSDLLRHLRAPSGRFCRVATVGSSAVIPFRSSKSKVPGMSVHEQQYRDLNLTKANDPLSSNLLDQNKQISWNKCLLRAVGSLPLEYSTTYWLADGIDYRDAPQSYTHTITIAQYFLKEGNMLALLYCAYALELGAGICHDGQSFDVHQRFIASRPPLGVNQDGETLAFDDEDTQYAYLLMASLPSRVETEYIRLRQVLADRKTQKEDRILTAKFLLSSWYLAIKIMWSLVHCNAMNYRHLRYPDRAAIINAGFEFRSTLGLAVDLSLEYEDNIDLAAPQQISETLAKLRTAIEIYNPCNWKTSRSPFPASGHIEEELY